MKQHRHSIEEIASKLEQADAMSAQGRRHGDIAKALHISVMTYHRWRRARQSPCIAVQPQSGGVEMHRSHKPANWLHDLQLENSRLRRMVTDLMLEKMNLEERIRDHAGHVTSGTRT